MRLEYQILDDSELKNGYYIFVNNCGFDLCIISQNIVNIY